MGSFFPWAKELKCLGVVMEVVADRRFEGSVCGDADAELIKKELNCKRKLRIFLRSDTHFYS